MGLVLPKNDELRNPPYATVSNILGWTYFVAWGISFYPQLATNYHQQTTIGLSLDFELLNWVGFCCYTTFAFSFYSIESIQDAYKARHHGHANKVTIQDLVFAVHAALITMVTIAQMFYYDGFQRTLRRLSLPISLVLLALLIVILVGLLLVGTVGRHEATAWLDFVYLLSYLKLFISTIKGLPQAYLNFRRKSTVGWSIHNILCDFTGGLLSVLQLILDCYITQDWGGITGDPLKFGLGLVSMGFDIVFFVQHFLLYPHRSGEESGWRKRDEGQDEGAGCESKNRTEV